MRNAWILAVLLIGCGGSPKTAPQTPRQADLTLGLGEMTFYDGLGPGLKVHADGSIEMYEHGLGGSANAPHEGWVNFGRVTTDGKVFGNAGQLVWTVLPDGTVQVAGGEVMPFKLGVDGLDGGGYHITIDATGIFRGGNPDYPIEIRVEGATDPATRRTALLLFGLTTTSKFDPPSQ